MRAAIAAILNFNRDKRYEVAIKNRYPDIENDSWEVHIFVREEGRSGLLECGLLCHAIELISIEFLCVNSEYDISTNDKPHFRPSFKIW